MTLGTVELRAMYVQVKPICYKALVTYGVRSPKFIWASVYVQLYSLAETPQLPPSPLIWAHIRGRYWSAKIDDISL